MGVDVLVGEHGWEVGAASFLHAFFSTTCAHLEPAGWGSRFPILMHQFYQGRLPAAHVRQAREELTDIRRELGCLPLSAVVWDIEDLGPKGELLPCYKKHFDLDLTTLPQWTCVDELRLVTGAVKHADGGSARELRGKREELFRSQTLNDMNLPTPDYGRWPLRSPLSGEDLFVTEEIFREYANATHDFVAAIVAHFQRNAGKGYPCS